jgi:predicted dehydrogenase
MKVGIIGYGLIGKERVSALKRLQSENIDIEQILIFDPYISFPNVTEPDIFFVRSIMSLKVAKVDWVIICTPHNIAVEYLQIMRNWDCKFLVEKPLGRTLKETQNIVSLFEDKQLYVGFNYRFFDGIQMLKEDIYKGTFGEIINANMILAHGGSPKDKDSWKLDPILGSPNSLLDPGIHFLDLINEFFNAPEPISGLRWKGFWNTGIDEEIHLLLKSRKTIINLQTSLVRWASTFFIQINGTEGYGIVEGRGKSYGVQTYRTGKKWGWQEGKDQRETEILHSQSFCAFSFAEEMYALFTNQQYFNCSGKEAVRNMELYEKCLKVLKCN